MIYSFILYSDLETLKDMKVSKIMKWIYLKRLDIVYNTLYNMPAFKECSTLKLTRERKELTATHNGTLKECEKQKDIIEKFLKSDDLQDTLKKHTNGLRQKIVRKAANKMGIGNAELYLNSIGILCSSEIV